VGGFCLASGCWHGAILYQLGVHAYALPSASLADWALLLLLGAGQMGSPSPVGCSAQTGDPRKCS